MFASLLLFLGLSCFCFSDSFAEFDILIKNGLVYDGTEAAPKHLDIGVKGDKIVAIGKLDASAKTVIQAQDYIVTPGFIDVHTHNDILDFRNENIDFSTLQNQKFIENTNNTFQGVTTVITGLCGVGSTHTDDWLRFIKKVGYGTNIYHLIPHGSLRTELFGNEVHTLNKEQMQLMKKRIVEEMENGAIGLSTGLIYTPGEFASTEELIELCKVIKPYGGIYVSHVRGENGAKIIDAYNEAIKIGREAGVPVQISHMKLCTPCLEVTTEKLLEVIEKARKEGLDVTGDQYPYTATAMPFPLPAKFKNPWGLKPEYKSGSGRGELLRKTQEYLAKHSPNQIMILDNPSDRTLNGKYLSEIAKLQGISPEEAVLRMSDTEWPLYAAHFVINEEIMKKIMQKEYVFTGSDEGSNLRTEDMPIQGEHPRAYGTFARKIRKYALEEQIITLNQAIMSMTSLPAKKFRMKRRGELKVGNFADITIIDLKNYRDLTTYENASQSAQGIKYLLVNGVIEINDGNISKEKGGQALRRDQ